MSNDTPVIPSQEAWQRVTNVVRQVEGGVTDYGRPGSPPMVFPARVVKVTGPAVSGFYPGKILRWNPTSEAFDVVCDCYIKQGS